jgi:hypothetical protein
MIKYPYALPNLVTAIFLIGSAMVVILGLEEVRNAKQAHDGRLTYPDTLHFERSSRLGHRTSKMDCEAILTQVGGTQIRSTTDRGLTV